VNLEDLRTYLVQYAPRARTILGRRVEPIGTEYDILEDVVFEVKRLKLSTRDVEIPGIARAWNEGLIQAAVAYFKDKVKKDIMPVQYAKDDNLIIEPLYRPKIFGLNNFTVNWSDLTPPATIDLINYNLQIDRELIILTDIIALDPKPAVTEILITVDGDTQRPLVTRKDWLATDLRIYELPFPVVADINLRIQARVEEKAGTFTYLPIGLHVVLGSIHVKTLA
jgi:hypothetical protein